MTEEEKQDEMCDICGGTPCDWEVYGHEILEDITEMYADEESSQVENRTQVDNRTIRKSAYKLFVYSKYGHLGKGQRIKISSCVLDNIRARWPDEDGNYTGYYSS